MSTKPRTTNTITIPAPTRGQNSRDNVDAMEPGFATLIQNFIPRNDRLELRGSAEVHNDDREGLSSTDSLFTHSDTDGTEKLFTADDNTIYDVTIGTATAIGAGTFSSKTWNHTQLDGASIICNGADVPQYYTVSAGWTATNYTGSGLTPASLVQVASYKGRLYFIEKDSAAFWYGADGAFASGTLTKFPVGKILSRGGPLAWIASWSRDTGSSSQELLIVMSQNGEILVYQGLFPGASDFSIVGKFYVGNPLGRRSYFWQGPDLIIMTVNGLFPLSSLLQLGQVNEYAAVSSNISGDFARATARGASLDGWSGLVHHENQLGIVNIPLSASQSYQAVYNPQSTAWAEFRGINARQFATMGGELYWVDHNGVVYKYRETSGAADDAIEGKIHWAYSYFSESGRSFTKRVTRLKPLARIRGQTDLKLGVDYDYKDRPSFSSKRVGSSGTLWNTANWNTPTWAGGLEQIREMFGGNSRGSSVQVRLESTFTGCNMDIYATNVAFLTGGSR